jgi:membrane-bound lytic murein transglycosylase MltF
MKTILISGLVVSLWSAAILSNSAEASVRHHKSSVTNYTSQLKHTTRHRQFTSKHTRRHSQVALRGSKVSDATRNNVMAMIKRAAPSYGVPTWFALRIAKVESNYNPNVRGAAGEYGVFQLKCATAKGVGFRGNCAALLNPSVNVQYGLKHLSMAVRMSHGNLKLAASKHNGGLGRKSMVKGYVAMVF